MQSRRARKSRVSECSTARSWVSFRSGRSSAPRNRCCGCQTPGITSWKRRSAPPCLRPSRPPGGGGAAALAGTLAASLVAMVARLTIGKKAYAEVEAQARDILAEAEQLRGELRRLVDEDAAAYAGVSQAYKIPKADPRRAQAIDDALLAAARPPADVVKHGRRLLALAQTIEHIGNKNAVSDARVAGMLAKTAIDGATENVNANLAGLSDPARAKASGVG